MLLLESLSQQFQQHQLEQQQKFEQQLLLQQTKQQQQFQQLQLQLLEQQQQFQLQLQLQLQQQHTQQVQQPQPQQQQQQQQSQFLRSKILELQDTQMPVTWASDIEENIIDRIITSCEYPPFLQKVSLLLNSISSIYIEAVTISVDENIITSVKFHPILLC